VQRLGRPYYQEYLQIYDWTIEYRSAAPRLSVIRPVSLTALDPYTRPFPLPDIPQTPNPTLPEGVEHTLAMAEQASQTTGITLITSDGRELLPNKLFFDDGAHYSQIDLGYALECRLQIQYLDQHVRMADGSLCQVAVLLDPIVLAICKGTHTETRVTKVGMQVMVAQNPWFQLLLGTDIRTPTGLNPMPKLGVCYYDAGYRNQATFPIICVQRRHPALGPAPPPLQIDFVGAERAAQRGAPDVLNPTVPVVSCLRPALCVESVSSQSRAVSPSVPLSSPHPPMCAVLRPALPMSGILAANVSSSDVSPHVSMSASTSVFVSPEHRLVPPVRGEPDVLQVMSGSESSEHERVSVHLYVSPVIAPKPI